MLNEKTINQFLKELEWARTSYVVLHGKEPEFMVINHTMFRVIEKDAPHLIKKTKAYFDKICDIKFSTRLRGPLMYIKMYDEVKRFDSLLK